MNRNKKRLIKKLMGVGIGRNDAAAFARVRSQLKASGQLGKLLPEMELPAAPMPPLLGMSVIQPQLLRAQHTVPRSAMYLLGPEALEEHVRRQLVQRLADGLMENALVRYRQLPNMGGVQITAEVRVLPPAEQEE